jgi:hypothetical protein
MRRCGECQARLDRASWDVFLAGVPTFSPARRSALIAEAASLRAAVRRCCRRPRPLTVALASMPGGEALAELRRRLIAARRGN